MRVNPRHRVLDRVFEVSIVLKGINGVLELVGGLALFFVDPVAVRAWLSGITAHFVIGHEHSPVWQWFRHLADALDTKATVFAGIYLLLHGVIKVVLVWALLKEKLWAYPWMVVALAAFIGYQCYELVMHFTWGMLALTVFDLFIVGLTLREWQLHRRRRAIAEHTDVPPSSGSSDVVDVRDPV
ncbi:MULTISPECIES: DUF2127 domain-containing protein [Bacteria]|uniref:DUF2127 domain-containing protein n=1 Tax=Bacteria TaxID=2 RepID=UPI003C7E5404